MRILYSAVFYLIIPFVLLRLYWRGFKTPHHRLRWNERFALYSEQYPQGVIWFHAVSVGEVEALFPLVTQMKTLHSDSPILITTMTPTGSARVKAVLGDTVTHVYVPYDLPDAINRFMTHFKPKLAVMIETEIWPNLFAHCGKNNIPLYIVNARIAAKSVSNYQKLSALIHPALAHVLLIATQTQADAERFIAIGGIKDKVKNLGNIKFDVEIAPETIAQGLRLKTDLFNERFVWLIASTHKDEEAIFLELYDTLKSHIPELLLVIVPRHQQRFTDVKKLCEARNPTVIRSNNAPVTAKTDIYVVDSIGELKMFYAAADIAFVGGSMVAAGGHNILEAAAVGVPVLFGAFMTNFQDIADGVLKQQAAIQCQTKEDVVQAVLSLYQQPIYRAELIANGKTFIRDNQGTVIRICQLFETALKF
ncbi:MAG: lipid IV(A) 3-deoxy-D-manno-octulosonic acid transferase [Methylococcales bacterium]